MAGPNGANWLRKLGHKYLAITITLKPRYYEWTEKSQYNYFAQELEYILQQECKVSDYLFYAEITDNSNIHYHGVLYNIGNIKRSVIKQKLAKVFGHLYFKSIKGDKGLAGWLDYIRKERKATEKILKVSPRIDSEDYKTNPRDLRITYRKKKEQKIVPVLECEADHKLYDFTGTVIGFDECDCYKYL